MATDEPHERVLLLSLRPRFADAIMAGTKTVELRRTRMQVSGGSRVLLYSSSPIRAVVGTAVLDRIQSESPDALWRGVGVRSAVSKAEFDSYFDGAGSAHGLHLRDVSALPTPVPLSELRRAGVEPPQSFRYLSEAQARALLTDTLASSRGPGPAREARSIARAIRRALGTFMQPLARLLP